MKFFGQIIRQDNIEKLIVQEKTEESRGKGRSPSRYID